MDIFVRNVPNHATKTQIERYFHEPFEACGIHVFHAEKMRDKPLAILTVLDSESGERFLTLYGVPPNSPPRVRATRLLSWAGKFLQCTRSRSEPSDFSVRSLAYEATQRAAKASKAVTTHVKSSQNKKITRFVIQGVQCGVWEYSGAQLAFTQHFKDARQGSISFGLNEAVILLGGSDTNQCRIDFSYYNARNIVLGNYYDPTVSFTLQFPPKFYEVIGEDVLAAALMSALSLGPRTSNAKVLKKDRLPSINDEHAKSVGSCFVYRVTLSDYNMLSTVRSLLSRNPKMPSTVSITTSTLFPTEPLERSFVRLSHELTDQSRYGRLPFKLLFQLYRLALNGVLSPLKVKDLLPQVFKVQDQYGLDAALSALRRFYGHVPFAGPDTEAAELSTHTLKQVLERFAISYDQYQYNPENPYQIVRCHTHINLIHKMIVTPTSIHLSGPEPEPTNRVLRKYSDNIDNFMRVMFQEEDGGSVRYDPRASQDRIFHERFKKVLDGNTLIAGRAFSFLGFSHSSLRAQSCWFMAPIFRDGNFRLPEQILKELGNFSSIRVPAKCAARIGQNFTDTNATIDLQPENIFALQPVLRNGYDFSDGVGTISEGLLRRIWRVYGARRLLKPTALQIRFQGYKGMVSVDSRLQGEVLKLRSNMNKFEAPEAWNLEICGAAFKPLPMILNRQLIKILEDLGIHAQVFKNLQTLAVDRLRYLTTTGAVNTATFLEEMDCPRATRIPSLIRLLNQVGLDHRQDHFLYSIVEMVLVTKLRDIKYRGRIPVDSGYTLYGIMDETGYLQDGEIYVVTEASPDGGRRVLVRDRVLVTRSPAMHPGDVQVVAAIDVPFDSPLKRLSNVVVFSQHGPRDLASQLSGGDLDGDIFSVIFDPQLIPATTQQAADYPRLSAVELDRPVNQKDITNFFVTFMESDQLGVLANMHLQLADQCETGTFDPSCIKLAGMASTAVDFSKTGIPVNMSQCPKHNRCRPDFMAPSPRVVVSAAGNLDFEEEDNDEDDAFEGMDVERRAFRYYESKKVLGQLYRAIDEQQFLSKMQQDQRRIMSGTNTSSTLLEKLLSYVKRLASQYGVLYSHHEDLAVEIRAGYEESLADILCIYAPSVNAPLTEHEAFAGTILGRKGGAQSKPLRELAKTMRERFDAIVEYTVMRIVKGDDQMRAVSDLDLLYDDDLDREVEGFPRAVACLANAVEKHGMEDRQLGELHSFKYIAAGVCLRELERYRRTTFGSYVLPPTQA